MSNLRNKLIRLAHANPSLREDLLPLLKEAKEDLKKGDKDSLGTKDVKAQR